MTITSNQLITSIIVVLFYLFFGCSFSFFIIITTVSIYFIGCFSPKTMKWELWNRPYFIKCSFIQFISVMHYSDSYFHICYLNKSQLFLSMYLMNYNGSDWNCNVYMILHYSETYVIQPIRRCLNSSLSNWTVYIRSQRILNQLY